MLCAQPLDARAKDKNRHSRAKQKRDLTHATPTLTLSTLTHNRKHLLLLASAGWLHAPGSPVSLCTTTDMPLGPFAAPTHHTPRPRAGISAVRPPPRGAGARARWSPWFCRECRETRTTQHGSAAQHKTRTGGGRGACTIATQRDAMYIAKGVAHIRSPVRHVVERDIKLFSCR